MVELEIDRANARYVVSRDGFWPASWRWTAEVTCHRVERDESGVTDLSRSTQVLRGDAFTRSLAWHKAVRAVETLEIA